MFRTNLLNTVAFAALVMGRPALKEVDNEPEVHVDEQSTQSGGDGSDTVQGNAGDDTLQSASGDTAPVAAADTYDMDDIADLEPRTRAPAIDFGFREWPIGMHALIRADLADRARSAVQNARADKGKDNNKQFITRSAVGLKHPKTGAVMYPDAKKGDIEVVRIKDKVAAAPAAEPETQEAPKVAEPA